LEGEGAGNKPKLFQEEGTVNATRTFSKIRDEFFDFIIREYPTTATHLGIHNRDTLLTMWSEEDISRRRKELKSFIAQLRKIDKRQLSVEDRVDYELLLGNLLTEQKWEEKFQPASSNPGIYMNFGLYVLLEREFAAAERRARSILSRLRKVPKILEQGKENLKNPPKVYTESAILSARGQVAFLEGPLKSFASRLRGPENEELRRELKDAITKASDALKSFIKFLELELLPRSTGNYAVGKSFFNFMLKNHHQVEVTADELLAFGKKQIARVKRNLAETAREISPRKSWEKLVDELKKDHPDNDELVSYYAQEMKRARDFVKKKGLVTFPPSEKLKVVPTPDFAKPLIPYAAFIPPAPFEKEKIGIFWVTTAPKDAPKKKIAEQLEGHPKAGIVVTALHEGYPGHHLQLSISAYHPDKLRHLLGTSVFVEGWALYCEELMWEQGFYDDPRCRLLQLKDELWRACRVVIDVSLHTGRMSFDDAVRFLVKVARLEEVNAISEVRRYCQSPTQPMSYLLGKVQIQRLLEDYKKARGASFELRRFHDELLSFGSLPIKHIRRLMRIPAER